MTESTGESRWWLAYEQHCGDGIANPGLDAPSGNAERS